MFVKEFLYNTIARIGKIANRDNNLQKEIYYSILFNQIIQSSSWLKDKSFAPGRWAVDYCFLYTMFRSIEIVKPQNILDIGLGQTSRMFAQYVNNNIKGKVTTIEHNPDWVAFFKSEYERYGNLNIKILDFKPNVPYQLTDSISIKDANIYDGFEEFLLSSEKYDFIVVDGPPLYNNKYNRPQIFDLIKTDKLADDFVVMMDDVDRKGELNTARLFNEELRRNGKKTYMKINSGLKMHCIITTEKYKYLTTL